MEEIEEKKRKDKNRKGKIKKKERKDKDVVVLAVIKAIKNTKKKMIENWEMWFYDTH